MRHKPEVSEAAIRAGLREGYGLAVTALDFLPVGNDATAGVYRVGTAGGDYLAKVKRGPGYGPSLAVPRYLADQGLSQVVAPLAGAEGALWRWVGEYALMVYPFIEGRTGREAGMTPAQWTELGAVLGAMHAPSMSAGLAGRIERETFVPAFADVVDAVEARLAAGPGADAAEAELAARWTERAEEIGRLATRADKLGQALAGAGQTLVVCHGDIHTDNVMIGSDGRLWIVDWDGPRLAPKERDLMFITDGVDLAATGPHARQFGAGYGAVTIDPLALAYYRYEWVVQELGDYGARVMLTPNAPVAAKAEAVREFRRLFEPGNVVAQAYRAEAAL